MPTAEVNSISINYKFDGSGDGQPIVLINGLADDLNTWDMQVPDLLNAGYKILRYDNRGIGLTSRPPGPYTTSLLANDLHALLVHLQISSFHLLGTSMGGMIAQTYALSYPNSTTTTSSPPSPHMLSLTLANTYAAPSPFCTHMFDLWAEMASSMSVQAVMRSVLTWAFTVPFFLASDPSYCTSTTPTATKATTETQADDTAVPNRDSAPASEPTKLTLKDVEASMAQLDMSAESYLAQLNVIRTFDARDALSSLGRKGRTLGHLPADRIMVYVGEEDILIPVLLSRQLHNCLVIGAVWKSCKGGHGACWEFAGDFNRGYIEFLQGLG